VGQLEAAREKKRMTTSTKQSHNNNIAHGLDFSVMVPHDDQTIDNQSELQYHTSQIQAKREIV